MSRANGRWFVCRYMKGYSDLGCTGLSIRVADLEWIVFDCIKSQMAAVIGADTDTDDIRQQAIQQTEMEKQLQSLRHKKRELYERFASEEISQDEYRGKNHKKVIVFHDHRIEIEYAVQDFLGSGNGTADVLPG